MKSYSTIYDRTMFTVNGDLSLTVTDLRTGTVSSSPSSSMVSVHMDYLGANRIYKPIGLLFWIDVRNGFASHWGLVDPDKVLLPELLPNS